MEKTDHVKTAIRWRPLSDDREKAVEKLSENILSFRQNQTFMFDNIFDGSSQSEVYNTLVKPLVEKAIEGFDCTFIAYGQTGSGKTYTMGFKSKDNPDENGVTTRVFRSLFSQENKFKMTLSLVEIYKDKAFDLFVESSEPFYVKGHTSKSSEAVRKSVKNEDEVQALISSGIEKRHSRATKMNTSSSRSHAILTIYLGIEHENNTKRESIINLVDLAGNEGIRKTGNMNGEALEEASSINKGLLNIKLVIDAMAKGKHIPYRSSVTTTVLQDSLKNESYLTLLGCISPYEANYGETKTTLDFIVGAKSLKKTPAMNKIIEHFQKTKTPVKKIDEKRTMFGNISNNRSFATPAPKRAQTTHQPKRMAISACKPQRPNGYSIGGYSASKFLARTSVMNSMSKRTNQSLRSTHSHYNSFSSKGNKSKTTAKNLFPDPAHDASMDVSFFNASTSSVIDKDAIINQTAPHNVSEPNNLAMSPATGAFQYIKECLATDKARNFMNTPDRMKILINLKSIIGPSSKKNDIKPKIHAGPNTAPATAVPSIKTDVPISAPVTDDTNLQMKIDNDVNNEILSTNSPCNAEHNVLPPNCQPIEMNEPVETFNQLDDVLDVIKETSERESLEMVLAENTVRNADQKSTVLVNNVEISLNNHTKHEEHSDGTIESGFLDSIQVINGNTNEATEGKQEVDGIPKLVICKSKENDEINSSLYEVKKTDCNSPVAQNFTYSSTTTITELETFSPLKYDSPEKDAFDVVASKATPNYMRLPLSPKIILHRINVLQCQENLKRRSSLVTLKFKRAKEMKTKSVKKSSEKEKSKSKSKKTKANDENKLPKTSKSKKPQFVLSIGTVKARKPQEKTKDKSKKADLATAAAVEPATNAANVLIAPAQVNVSRSRSILHILNTGAVNDLKKLPQIGPKKAEQIFAYRGIHGGFDTIDAMMNMQFWPAKTHQRFLVHNLLT